jgi:hypothetical protein
VVQPPQAWEATRCQKKYGSGVGIAVVVLLACSLTRCQKMSWWHYSKCVTTLGLQVQNVAKKENFPHKGDSGLSQTLGEQRWSFFELCLPTCKAMSLSCYPNSTMWFSSTRLQ